MKLRYTTFIAGALLGFLVGAFSTKVNASDENGDVFCLAQNIYFESANQPLAGKIAVAQVVQNRVVHPSYPDTISVSSVGIVMVSPMHQLTQTLGYSLYALHEMCYNLSMEILLKVQLTIMQRGFTPTGQIHLLKW